MPDQLPNSDIPGLPEGIDTNTNDWLVQYSIARGRAEKVKAGTLVPTTDVSPGWSSTYVYSDGEVTLWGTEFYESDQNGNAGHLPSEPGSLWWHVVSKSASNADWTAGVYTELNAIVYYNDIDGAAHALRLATATPRPFNSSDLKAEYLAGKWQRLGRELQRMDALHNAGGGGSYPADGTGSGPSGLIMQGNSMKVGTAGSDGSGNELLVGFVVTALVDNPGSTPGNWEINQG